MSDQIQKKSSTLQQRGAHGEELAAQYLIEEGWRILERNFKTKYGEIDLIVERALEKEQGRLIAFVEVKSRTNNKQTPPELSVTAQKRRTIIRVARHYADHNIQPCTGYRFDVISVDLSEDPAAIEHFEGAFDSSGNPY